MQTTAFIFQIIDKNILEIGDKNEEPRQVAWIDVKYKDGQEDKSELIVLENGQKRENKSCCMWLILVIIVFGLTLFGLAYLQKFISDDHGNQ